MHSHRRGNSPCLLIFGLVLADLSSNTLQKRLDKGERNLFPFFSTSVTRTLAFLAMLASLAPPDFACGCTKSSAHASRVIPAKKCCSTPAKSRCADRRSTCQSRSMCSCSRCRCGAGETPRHTDPYVPVAVAKWTDTGGKHENWMAIAIPVSASSNALTCSPTREAAREYPAPTLQIVLGVWRN